MTQIVPIFEVRFYPKVGYLPICPMSQQKLQLASISHPLTFHNVVVRMSLSHQSCPLSPTSPTTHPNNAFSLHCTNQCITLWCNIMYTPLTHHSYLSNLVKFHLSDEKCKQKKIIYKLFGDEFHTQFLILTSSWIDVPFK